MGNLQKITIVRNSWDRAVSRYFWDKALGRALDLDFREFYHRFPERLSENLRIAPLSGRDRLDVYIRYDNLEADMREIGLRDIWDVFSSLRSKSGYRPRFSGRTSDVYSRYPDMVTFVADHCREEIE